MCFNTNLLMIYQKGLTFCFIKHHCINKMEPKLELSVNCRATSIQITYVAPQLIKLHQTGVPISHGAACSNGSGNNFACNPVGMAATGNECYGGTGFVRT